jgi:hypothetical protein
VGQPVVALCQLARWLGEGTSYGGRDALEPADREQQPGGKCEPQDQRDEPVAQAATRLAGVDPFKRPALTRAQPVRVECGAGGFTLTAERRRVVCRCGGDVSGAAA